MKVICIDNSEFENELTINTEYTAYVNILFQTGYYSIDNDLGEERTYKKQRFVPVFRLRQNKLTDLLD